VVVTVWLEGWKRQLVRERSKLFCSRIENCKSAVTELSFVKDNLNWCARRLASSTGNNAKHALSVWLWLRKKTSREVHSKQ
jgi:hypothetical protein